MCVATRPPRQLAAGGREGPGQEPRAASLCLPHHQLPTPGPPAPTGAESRGPPRAAGASEQTESQRQLGAWREDARSPGSTGAHARTAALRGHTRMHTSPQTHTPTDPPMYTQPFCAQGVPPELPGGETEGAAGRLAQGPHSSPSPAPGPPGAGAPPLVLGWGACWEGCWAGLGQGSQRPTCLESAGQPVLTSQRGELRLVELSEEGLRVPAGALLGPEGP